MGSFLTRLTQSGARRINWQNFGVRLVDAFTLPSLNERLDTLEAHHAETHSQIVAVVAKFETLIAENRKTLDANVEALHQLREFHESRQDRIKTIMHELDMAQQGRDSISRQLDELLTIADQNASPAVAEALRKQGAQLKQEITTLRERVGHVFSGRDDASSGD